MLRSLFAGVAGLRGHQTKMDVIGNNIANVNTYGFKASRVTFQEMFSQTMRTASAPTNTLGGTNPAQIGLGVSTQSIDVLHSTGGTQNTDQTLDLALDGSGFFEVKSDTSSFYTRAGNFYLDSNGMLVTGNGLFVQGICLLEDDAVNPDIDPTELGVLMGMDPTEVLAGDYVLDHEQVVGNLIFPLDWKSISIDQSGLVTGIDPEGVLKPIAQLTISTYANPPGLTKVGNNLYQESNNSGIPMFYKPGEAGAATLIPGALEMSNVDLSKEFTDMIVTQRGFQANSRVITVSDTLLEELINLKR